MNDGLYGMNTNLKCSEFVICFVEQKSSLFVIRPLENEFLQHQISIGLWPPLLLLLLLPFLHKQ